MKRERNGTYQRLLVAACIFAIVKALDKQNPDKNAEAAGGALSVILFLRRQYSRVFYARGCDSMTSCRDGIPFSPGNTDMAASTSPGGYSSVFGVDDELRFVAMLERAAKVSELRAHAQALRCLAFRLVGHKGS